jgi:hypothetical protein
MIAKYTTDSPYFNTPMKGSVLGVMNHRTIPAEADDTLHTLTSVHEYRPDLLAYDVYKNSNLWWVFAVRNPNAIKDPIWDFRQGTVFYIPKLINIQKSLGI